MIPTHKIDQICSCKECMMIDIAIENPKLNKWENEFLKSMLNQGWRAGYSQKQKEIIFKIYQKVRP